MIQDCAEALPADGGHAWPFLPHLRHLPMDGLDNGPGRAQEDLMVAVSSETVQGTHHQLAPRLRAAVLGPRGGGTTRRAASASWRPA